MLQLELPPALPGRPPQDLPGIPRAGPRADALPPASRSHRLSASLASRRSPSLELAHLRHQPPSRAPSGLPLELPTVSRPRAADLDAIAPSASRSSSCQPPIITFELLPASSSRPHPRAAGLELEFLHGQVRAVKSTVKSGDQKPAAPPPKSHRRSLL
jgi:hypothetical protein